MLRRRNSQGCLSALESTGVEQTGGHVPGRVRRWEKAVEKLSDANDALQNLHPSVPCQHDLDKLAAGPSGHTLGEIRMQANVSNWNDATSSSAPQSGLFTPGTRAYSFWSSSSMTIQQYFAANPGTEAESALTLSGLSGNIYFRPGYINSHSVGFDAALLMHEVMHNLGWDDDQLKKAYGIPLTRPSGDVTNLLASDCFGVTR